MAILVLIATDKGLFRLRSEDRASWRLDGPSFKGWKVTAVARDGRGRFLAATASDVYGPAIHASADAAAWTQLESGPTWSEASGRVLRQVWTLAPVGERLYAGVDDAGLFATDDGGRTWRGFDGLNEHSTRAAWYPGAGGLCLHAVLFDPRDARRMWAAISSVGVLRSDDGGATWAIKNHGIPGMIEDDEHPDLGCCVHALVSDPDDADRIWRREHNGMFRSANGGESWERIENGLGSWFGFPIARDARSRALFAVPLESDEYRLPKGGALTVHRSTDGGDSWHPLRAGLPQRHAYHGVLRAALAVDGLDPCGVYLGTTGGAVFVSSDRGERFRRIPALLPRVLAVRAFEV